MTTVLRLATMPAHALPNAQRFRANVGAALKAALEKARSYGYSSDVSQLAFFAVVAFVDESVLKLQNPAFGEWAQRTLQEEMFGHNRGGEVFFEYLRSLLGRQDSPEVADALEVFCLCMLLGFQGQFAINYGSMGFFGQSGSGSQLNSEIQALIRQTRDKIDRIRGHLSFLPDGPPPPEVGRTATVDRWSRGFAIAAVILLVLTVLAYGGFWMILNAGATQLS